MSKLFVIIIWLVALLAAIGIINLTGNVAPIIGVAAIALFAGIYRIGKRHEN